ncbi:MAG: ABC transporter substrate-binding protein [bacterium]
MPKLVSRIKVFLMVSLLVLIPLADGYSQQQELKKVTFMPSWIPQEQFAGYYMAKEKGIYKKYGLDVTIKSSAGETQVINALKKNEIDFGVMFLFSAIMERDKGTKLVNVGQIFQRCNMMFVAKKKSGIKTIKDFNGKKIGIWKTIAKELTTGFLKKNNINAEIVVFNSGIQSFLKDAVDVIIMMNYNEYKRMLNSGINDDEVNKFYFYDYNVNFPEDGIYCMESTYDKDPVLCRKFVAASMEGWEYALGHIDETIQIMNKYKEISKISYNRSHSIWMLNSMKNIIHPPGKNVANGILLKSDFDSITEFLFNNKFIFSKPLFNDFYKGGN